MIRVRLTAQLKDWTGGVSEVELDSVADGEDQCGVYFGTTTGHLFVGRN